MFSSLYFLFPLPEILEMQEFGVFVWFWFWFFPLGVGIGKGEEAKA